MSIAPPDSSSILDAPDPVEENPAAQCGILIVDEDPAFRLGLKTFLREYVGCENVTAVSSGNEALEILRSDESIELVTLDYQMPGLNGIQVMEELSGNPPRRIGVIMITGYPSEELETDFRSYHSETLLTNQFVEKPVSFEKLEPLIMAEAEAVRNPPQEESPNEVPPLSEESKAAEEQRLSRLERKLHEQQAQIEDLNHRMVRMRRRWIGDLIKLAAVGLAIWALVHFGVLDQLKPGWEQLKADLEEVFPRNGSPDSATSETQN